VVQVRGSSFPRSYSPRRRVADNHNACTAATAPEEVRIRTTTAATTASDAVLSDLVEPTTATTVDASGAWRESVAPEILPAAASATRVVDLRAGDSTRQSGSASSSSTWSADGSLAARTAASGAGEGHAAES
jgi:hypothetical protein